MARLHQPGDIVADRYRIVAFLSQGVFSQTYEAEDLRNHKCVALKVVALLQMQEWQTLKLLLREAKVLSNLQHEAIPPYQDYFELDTSQDRRFYLVREIVSGQSLASLITSGWRVDEEEFKGIALQALTILDYLHTLTPTVLHRDLKPNHLIRSPEGKIFLVDFGAVQDVCRNTLTRGETFVGTLDYMPPEQFSGQVSPASDLYSLGATLLFLVTGRSPLDFPQHRLKVAFQQQVKIAPQLSQWLSKLLEPAPEDRFPSAKAAICALAHIKVSPRGLTLKAPKPPGSQVNLRKTNRRLVVELPPPRGWLLLLPLSWNLFILVVLLASLFGGWTGFLTTFLVLSPWWILGWLSLREAASATLLELDQQKFQLKWSIRGFTHRSVRGKTKDIEYVELEIYRGSRGRTSTNCTIWEGVRKRRFGSPHKEDNEWLVGEISDFLAQLRTNRLDV